MIIILANNVFCQDTTPPDLIAPARDTSFECGQTTGLIDKLTLWFNTAGGAIFEDNSGSYTVQTNITLLQAITIYNNSLDILCGNKQKVDVTFTAVDPSGNTSQSTTASFFTTDITPPSINSVAKVQYSCVEGIRDTLTAWIKNKAGYVATDLCSNTVQWTTYTYAISAGGIDLISGGGNIASGPYPMIPDGICNWVLRINFFVRDECGNQTLTPATTTFTVIDNIAPVFVQKPADITVSCDNIPPVATPTVIDYCDRSVTAILSSFDTQSSDVASCTHYNYTITRIWTATDECGNSSEHTQIITVVDNTKPTVEPNLEFKISCTVFDEHIDSIFIKFSDNCSAVKVGFADTIRTTACTSIVERTYSLTDICNNTTTYKQRINVVQNVGPTISKHAVNRTYSCTDQEDFDAQLFIWIQDMGESEAISSCGPIQSFAAVKNSYKTDEISTFPGIKPTTLPAQICPTPLKGFLRYIEVDFVYYDTCGNVSVSPAVFGVIDTLAPIIMDCPKDLTVSVDASGCLASVKIKVPEATDDCVESSSFITKQATALITSAEPPGPTAIVDPITLKIGPFNPFTSTPLDDAEVTIRLLSMDIDDATEFFNIFDEDNALIGTTTLGSDQCASVEMMLTLPKDKINRWIQDGFIDLRFEPFIAQGSPVLSINNICGGSRIEANIGFQIDIANAIRKSYSINGGEEIPLTIQDSLILFLNVGEQNITFFMEDCGTNRSQCDLKVLVKDETKPIITCPENITAVLMQDQCQAEISLPINFEVSENCAGNRPYDQTVPLSNEAASIIFSLNSTTNLYEARNKQIIFTNVFPILFSTQNVRLTIEFFGDNNDVGEYFEIQGPNGYKIGNTNIINSNGCEILSVTTYEIPIQIFNSWISNKTITLLAVPFNGGNGINPCIELSNGNTTDGKSYIKGRLTYSDFSFSLSSAGATTFSNSPIPDDIFAHTFTLSGGKNTLTIHTSDRAGNTGNCTFEVNVRDAQAPIAMCKNASVTLDPSGLVTTIIASDLIDNGSMDNCKISSFKIEPPEVNCSQANTDVAVSLIVFDDQGNSDTCTSLVRVRPFELKPTFSAGLCSNDTLKLFANLPPSSVPGTYTFRWTGPGNIEFFTENPSIPNADESYNGVYVLTVTGFNGCVSMGSVIVNIKPLTNPGLITNQTEVCLGSDVIFSTTNYSGDIYYDWYEGIFPTGILIRTTQIPDLIIQPSTPDAHFYYVIARGENCSSNPSPLLKITVLEVPDARVKDLFLSPCEGDNITLGSATANPRFTYSWTGPNGYTSQGANPLAINNVANINAGNYALVINNGKCISDTAVTRVTILERPSQPQIAGANIFCEGVVFNLVATGSANVDKYEWFLNGILFTTTQDNSLTIANAQSSLQGTWTVRTTIGNCTSLLSTPKSIGIDVSLIVTATNTGPVCMGDSITLSATFVPNATYTWQGPVADIPSVENPKILAVPGDYSVTITTITGCKNNANTNVRVISVPQITALSNDVNACVTESDIITFHPSVVPNVDTYTYVWKGPNGFMSNDKNPTITNLDTSKKGSYSLIIYNGSCPSNELSTVVDFDIIPAKPILMAEPFYCVGDSIVIQSSEILAGADYIWNTPLGLRITKTPELKIVNVSNNNTGIYSLIIASAQCGSESSTDLQIIIREKPSKAFITTNSPICYGDTIKMNVNNVAGARYIWTGPSVTSQNSAQIVIPNAKITDGGNYQVKLEKDGCTSDLSDATVVIVKDSIVRPIFETTTISLCNNNTSGVEICLNSNVLQAGASYQIVHNSTQQILTQGSAACQYITDMTDLNEGPNFVSAIATFDGCISTASLPLVININVPPNVKAAAIENDIISCPDEIVRLISRDGPPLVNVKWTAVSPELNISDINAVSPSVSGLKSGNNIVYLDYSVAGCIDYSRDTIQIYVEFQPSAINDEYVLTYGDKGLFNILANDSRPDKSKVTILTQPKNGTVILRNDMIEYTPDPRYLETQTFTYEVCADLCEGLCDQAMVTVRFDDNISCKAPNIFTPNGDGINDFFIIPCLNTDRFPDNKVMIFNEWGNEVYYAAPYANDWSGTYGGKDLPAGTYFYIIETGDGRQPLNGFLILQR